MGAHRHARGADTEGLAQLAPECAHGEIGQGRTGGAVRPVVSGRPNIRFMFCIACPAAPLTRLSSTARMTAMSPCCGRCTAIRQMLEARTERVSGWLPAGMALP